MATDLRAVAGALVALGVTLLSPAARADDSPAMDKRDIVHLTAEGGATFARFGGVAFSGLELGLGVEFRPTASLSVGVGGRYSDTTSDAGLHLRWGSLLSGDVLWRPWRLRIGGGTDLLYFVLPRVTADESLTHPGLGVHAHLGIDVLEWGDDHAVELAVVPAADWFFGAALTSATFTANVRW